MKKVVSIIMAIAIVLGFALVPGGKAEAADVPSLTARKAVYYGEAGKTCTACEYEMRGCTHKYEKVIITVTDANGKEVLHRTKSYYWLNSELKTGAKTDTLIYSVEVGKSVPTGTTFTVVAKIQYSDDGTNYVDAPNPQTTSYVIGSDSGAHANEWYNGYWYNADGTQTYPAVLTWQGGGNSWWVQDTQGWYPTSKWVKIDGAWYYFTASGYMDYSEYRDGYWLNADGSASTTYTHGTWKSDSHGWWYEDNGWYPVNQSLWIDGVKYYFGADGYMQ